MRLTLRTMLAYLDEILEPPDSQDVGKKIEESEFASSLMHRIRDVTRRTRLAAPRLEGRGMGLDPNTVAEYLDNTLPSERVPDFEKVCLESDVHLAEVASAHQILALVLGEPAEIEPSCRQRVYDLPNAASRTPSAAPGNGTTSEAAADAEKAPSAQSSGGGSVPSAAAVPPKVDVTTPKKKKSKRRKLRRVVEVPDYLREAEDEETGRSPWLVAAAALLLLVGAGLVAQWQWPGFWRSRSGQHLAKNQLPNELNNGGANAEEGKPEGRTRSQGDEGGEETPGQSSNDENSAAATEPSATDAGHQAAEDGELNESKADAGDASADAATKDEADGAEENSNAAPSVDAADESDTSIRSLPIGGEATDDDDEGAPDAPLPGGKSTAKKGPTKGGKKTDDTEAPKPAKRAGEVIGRLTTEHDVLLRWDEEMGWKRLPIRETVHAGDRLLALPTFKPNVALGVGVTLQMLGGSEVQLEAPNDQGIPGVRVARGRVVLLPVKPDSQVRLRAGDQGGLVTFGQDDAPLAVEVVQELPDGADPESETATTRAEFYVTVGEIHWAGERAPGEQAVVEKIQGPARRVLEGEPAPADAEPIEADALPGWTGAAELGPLEKSAASFLDHELTGDRPLPLVLEEVVGHRKIENSLLALQSLVEIDEYKLAVLFLKDPDKIQKMSIWVPQVENLHAALARGPEHALKIRKAFEDQRGKSKGLELYRMLWAYDAKQLNGGDDRLLVQYLNHEDLDMRVLSFWNLRRITAGTTFGYQPQLSEAKRHPMIKRWQQRLEAKEIAPKPTEEE